MKNKTDCNMKDAHLQQLEDLREDSRWNSADVFVPYKAENWRDNRPRVMICGKATNGWEQSGADEFVQGKLVDGEYSSLFWTYTWEILGAVHRTDLPVPGKPRDPKNVSWRKNLINNCLYWTNIAKVGGEEGNPPGELLKEHKKLFVDILTCEIKSHKPDGVVFTTKDKSYYAELTKKVIEKFAPDRDPPTDLQEDNFWHCSCKLGNAKLKFFWTRHPQGWSKEERINAVECISRTILAG